MTGVRCLRCSHCFHFELETVINEENNEAESKLTCSKNHDDYVDWNKEPCEDFKLDPIF